MKTARVRPGRWACVVLLAFCLGCGASAQPTQPVGDAARAKGTNENKTASPPAAKQSNPAQQGIPGKESPDPVGKAVPPKAAEPPKPPAPVDPPTFAKVIAIVDMRTAFEILPQAKDVRRTLADLFYSAPGTMETASEFHAAQLRTAGWKPLDEHAIKNDRSNMSYFKKDGYHLFLNVSSSSEQGHVYVSLDNLGNIDCLALPHPAEAKVAYVIPQGASFTVTRPMFGKTDSKSADRALMDVGADFVRTGLQAQGWTPFRENFDTGAGLGSSTRLIKFVQRAARLDVYVRSRSKDEIAIDYNKGLLKNGLSVVGNATDVILGDTVVKFDTDASPQDVASSYRRDLGALGWTPMAGGEDSKDIGEQLVLEHASEKETCMNVIALRRGPAGASVSVSVIRRQDATELIDKLRKSGGG